MGRLISVSETARRLGLTEQTIRNWVSEGHIKVKKVGRARYIDENTINALQDTAKDIKEQKVSLEELKARMSQKNEELRMKMDDSLATRRFRRIVLGTGLHTGFFRSVLNLYNVCGILKGREVDAFDMILNGYTLEDVAKTYGITRERARQIAERVILKSSDLTKVAEKIKELDDMQAEMARLKSANKMLKEQLKEYETVEEPSDEKMNETDTLCQLLSTPLKELNISTRAQNCLRAGRVDRRFNFRTGMTETIIVRPCKTLGDVCRLTQTEYMLIRNAGKKSLDELTAFLEEKGLSWGMNVDKIYKDHNQMKMYL